MMDGDGPEVLVPVMVAPACRWRKLRSYFLYDNLY